MSPKYDVFISHAGEDKSTLAVLVYEGLKRRGISAFLDERELAVAGDAVQDMDHAMQTAIVGLFLLSPEFALKYYPMLELECFLRRAGLLGDGAGGSAMLRPKLIPVFYRLTVAACKYADAFWEMGCDQFVQDRFQERVGKGETSIDRILECLTLLARHTGVENKSGINNDDSEVMAQGREQLAEKICDEVTRVIVSGKRNTDAHEERSRGERQCSEEELHSTFYVPENPEEVVLDFSSAHESSERQTHEAEVLREALRDETGTRIVGIVGAGGVGKSCILREVARHEQVRERFPGGVYFMSLGMDASIDTLRSELLRILHISGGRRTAERLRDEMSMVLILEEVGKLVGRERSLVLLDDVWDHNGLTEKTVEEVSGMLSHDHGGMVMFTTRFTSIALKGHATVQIEPREALSETSRGILLSYSKCNEEDVRREGLGWLIEKLLGLGAGLPVSLAVIGRGVRKLELRLRGKGGRGWTLYWKKISSSRESLVRDDVGDYKGLTKTISVALAVLDENEVVPASAGSIYTWTEMFASLSVMKKHTVIPVGVLERMLTLNSDGDALTVMEGLMSVGLGEIVLEEEEGVMGLKIHDLLHDFAVLLARDMGEALKWHERLLEGYICSPSEGLVREWWKSVEDGYIFQNVCRHLRGSGNIGELVELLLKAEWTALRHEVGSLQEWRRDFAECLEAIDSCLWDDKRKNEVKEGLCLVREVIADCWGIMSGNMREFGYQVFGRLEDMEDRTVWKYLKSVADWHPRPWLRPVSHFLPRPGELGREFTFKSEVSHVVLQAEPFSAVVGVGAEVVIVDLEEMCVARRLRGHAGRVGRVWASEDWERALSFSWDGTVREWSIGTGEEVRVTTLACSGGNESTEADHFRNGRNHFTCATFSDDGRFLITGSKHGAVEMWDSEGGERVGDVVWKYVDLVEAIEMSSDGRVIFAVAEWGRNVRMCHVSTREQRQISFSFDSGVRCISLSPDGSLIALGCDDFSIRVWNVESRTQICGPFRGHLAPILSVVLSPDGQRVVSSSMDGSVRIWDFARGVQVGPALRGHSDLVGSVAMSATGQFVVSAGEEGSLRVWDIEKASGACDEGAEYDFRFTCLTGSENGSFFVSGSSSRGGTVQVWDATTGNQIGEALSGHNLGVLCVAVSPDSQRVVSGSADTKLIVWDVASHSQVGEAICGHTEAVTCVIYSPNGRYFVSGSDDITVRIWSADNHSQIAKLICVDALPTAEVAFLLPRRLRELLHGFMVTCKGLLSTDENNPSVHQRGNDEGSDVNSSEVTTVSLTSTALYVDRGVENVAVSPDGQKIVSSLMDSTLWVWDLRSRRQLGSAQTVERDVERLEISTRNEVRVIDTSHETKWRLDDERGLVRVVEAEGGENSSTTGHVHTSTTRQVSPVACRGRFVQTTCGDVTLATLPFPVQRQAWHFDSSRGILAVGIRNDRLLIFRVE